MFIPIGTDRPRKRPTVVTYWLIGLTTLAYVAQEIAIRSMGPEQIPRLLDALALARSPLHPWGLVTYQFLHGGLMHLLGNMLFLFVFGPNVEDRRGRVGFLALYLVGGGVAGLAHTFASPAPVIGASGAIAGVTGAYLVLFPKTTIRLLVWFLIIGAFSIPAWWFISFAIMKDLVFQGLGQAMGAADGVARMAHLGGYAFGAVVSIALLKLRILEREPYDLFTLGRQAHRRRAFKELTSRGRAPWTSTVPTAAPVRRREGGPRRASRASEREQQLAAARNEVSERLSASDLDGAARRYLDLLDEHGEQVMHRGGQLAIANHLAQQGRHEAAAVAYRLYLDRFPSDAEVHRTRLLLALLQARYLNDPIAARKLLDDVDAERVGDEARPLIDALRSEIG